MLATLTTQAAPLHAQASGASGKDAPLVRPPLPVGADTNDFTSYVEAGNKLLDRNPEKAIPYFRFAGVLDPQVPEPFYGERIAILLSDRSRLLYYMRGDRKVHELPAIKRADSLQALALTRAPLFFRRYDRKLLTAFFEAAIKRSAQSSGMNGEDESEMRFEMMRWLDSPDAPPVLRAWFAYSDGDFRRSARLYADAIRKAKKSERGDLLAERARVMAHIGASDSAVAIFRESMAADSARDKDRLVFAIDSRAQMEHILGALLESEGDTAGAREAYERALTQDLTYFPAHIALGTLAYSRHDTATATHELREAMQLASDDPSTHYTYGLVLATTGNVAEGVNELLKARELAPLWAEPYILLARLHDAADMRTEAEPFWRDFLARASQRHPGRPMAEERLATTAAR